MRKKNFKKAWLAGLGLFGLVILGIFSFSLDNRTKGSQATVIPSKEEVALQIAKLSIPFVPNAGQLAEEVKFSAKIFSGSLFVTNKELVYSLVKREGEGRSKEPDPLLLEKEDRSAEKGKVLVFRETFLDSEGHPVTFSPQGEEEAVTKVSYFKGNDPGKWRSNLPSYNLVSLGEVYPGIEVKLKALGKNVEKLFYVGCGANVEKIRIKVEGAKALRVSSEGKLILETELGEIAMREPIGYQEAGSGEVSIGDSIGHLKTGLSDGVILKPGAENQRGGGYGEAEGSEDRGGKFLAGEKEKEYINIAYEIHGQDEYGFKIVGDYNPELPLIIDPAFDTLLASTFLGGSDNDYSQSIALDSLGNVYVTGYTISSNFPVTAGAYDNTYNNEEDVFVSKFTPDLNTLLASTFIGYTGNERSYSISLDILKNVYITGFTESDFFPTTPGAYDTSLNGGYDVFVTKLSPSLGNLLASTFIGGNMHDYGHSIAVDSSGIVYITGYTFSSNYPTTAGAYDTSYNGGSYDVFISKFSTSLGSLLASTFIGGEDQDISTSITLDSPGYVYITGYTRSISYPTTPGAYDTTNNGGEDVFVSKFSPLLDNLLASTFVGGSNHDRGNCIALDSSGNVYITGRTASSNYPTTPGAYDTTHNGGDDVFVSKLSPSLSTLMSSTFIGGAGDDYGYSLALDSSRNVYVTGYNSSSDFPTTPG
ncbi:MAG: SBBP repeat-containing protein, partial [Candidatus Bathyarchaeia archaeon]